MMDTRCTLAAFVLVALLAWPAAGRAENHELTFEGELETSYTSNLFHTPKRRLDQFDTKTDPGQRFHGMTGPGDVVTVLRVSSVAKKNDFDLKVGANYVRPTQNEIAQYFEADLQVDGTLTRRDRLRFGLSFTPNRFRKNYRDPAPGGRFAPADTTEWAALVDMRHRFHKRLAVGVRYDLAVRQYDAPFSNRDRTGHQARLYSKIGIGRRLDVSASMDAGAALSPGGTEDGEVIDRSFQTLRGRTSVDWHLPAGWSTRVLAEYRVRRYTTAESADQSRYKRNDARVRVGLGATKTLGRRAYLTAALTWMDSTSNRDDPGLDADEAGYEELVGGLGGGLRF